MPPNGISWFYLLASIVVMLLTGHLMRESRRRRQQQVDWQRLRRSWRTVVPLLLASVALGLLLVVIVGDRADPGTPGSVLMEFLLLGLLYYSLRRGRY